MNKRILFSTLAFFLGALYLPAADFNAVKVPSVTVTVSDFTLDYSPASRAVSLTPHSGGTVRSGTSDANGVVGFVRVTPGIYTLTIAGIALDPLTLQVPNQTGTLSASNLVISAWTPPAAATAAKPTDNLRAWSLLGTSSKQDTLAAASNITVSNITSHGILKLSGETNEISIADGELLLDGDAIGGGGETIWTNVGPGTVRLFDDLDSVAIKASTGGLMLGPNAQDGWGALGTDDGLIIIHDPTAGDANELKINFSSVADVDDYSHYAEFFLQVQTNSLNLNMNVTAPDGENGINLTAAPGSSELIMRASGNPVLQIRPGVGDGVLPFLLGANVSHTSGNLLELQNNGTNKLTVDYSGAVGAAGIVTATNGFSSVSTTAAVAIAATGWTNTFGKNAVVYYDGTAVTAIVKNNAGTSIYTNAVALTGNSSILLQPSGAVILSGTGVTGRATPF